MLLAALAYAAGGRPHTSVDIADCWFHVYHRFESSSALESPKDSQLAID